MPKLRQIPNLFPRKLADGTTVWHWKPSAKLRKAGFVNVKLGTDQADAIRQALDLNAQVDQWQVGSAIPSSDAEPRAPRPRLPRVVRFSELVTIYRRSSDFTELAPKTQAEYRTRLNQLESWAMDGTLPVREISTELVTDLRAKLLEKSRFKAAAVLRVLRLLMAFAERESIIPKGSSPAREIRIPEPPARKIRMSPAVRDAIVEAAIELDPDDVHGVALAIDLGFWTLQRQADILHANRLAWRVIEDEEVDPRHMATLANARGRVMGFRLQQRKTATWIDAPLPPMLHDRVEARLKRHNSGLLFPHSDRGDEVVPSWAFQRVFRAARESAAVVAICRGNLVLAEQIDACQFRDLRRTGMIAYGSAGVKVNRITALSGHAVLGKKTILDTYMPGDTAGAIACVSTGYRAWKTRQAKEAQAV